MALGAVVVVAVALFLWAQRGRELFCLSVRSGRVLVVRGRVPPALLGSIREIVAGVPAVERATIRAVRGDQGARITSSGTIDEGRAQRLRNVFGLYPIARLRAAAPVRQPTLGQWLGIAWLAWLFDRSRDG
jgi:hypothetical protein